jgi:hypothetical protein
MTAHLSNEEISSYCERRLSRDDLYQVHQHLFSCEKCYDEFLRIFQTKRSFPIEIDLNDLAGLKGWHLQGQELKDCVEGRLAEPHLSFANIHLKECVWCREEAHHISEFSDKLPYYLSKRHAPLEQPTVLRSFYTLRGNLPWGSLKLARAAAILLFVLGSAMTLWLVLRAEPDAQQSSLSAPTHENSPARADISEAPKNVGSLSTGQPIHSDGNPRQQERASVGNNAKRSRRSIEQESEASLIATNLVMPKVIEMFDRSRVILRGEDNRDESFSIISPYATVITDDRPTFRWTALNGVSSYTISVYDADLNLVRSSDPITETQWSMPKPLQRGMIYTWIVTALKDGKEVLAPVLPTRAEFKVIEKPELIKLNRSIRHTGSHVARGILYAKAGLLDKAEHEFQVHLTLDTGDEHAKELLQLIKSWRGP